MKIKRRDSFKLFLSEKKILSLIKLHCFSTGYLVGVSKYVNIWSGSSLRLSERFFPSLIYLFRLRNHWFRNDYGDKKNGIAVCS